MKRGLILIAALFVLAAQAAWAQTPTPPDSSAMKAAPAQPAPAPTPPPPPPPPPPSAKPQVYRFGSLSGSWLFPSGEFDKVANDGWAITLEGYQFINPSKKIAVGSQVAYQSFGKKNGVSVSNFPVDALLRFYPKPGKGKIDIYGTGGLGFNYTRTDVGYSSRSDYYFGTQAGVGMDLHTSGPVSFVVDAVYHWIFATGTDIDFVALRAGIAVPMMR